MPSETFYVKPRHITFLDGECDERENVENPSQALQEVLDEYMGAADG